jgi:hypothetical protein
MKTVVRRLVGACVAVTLALWLGPPLLGWVSARGQAPAERSTRYYVVQAPQADRPEHPYDIAVRTLGDGNRYREIFELNRDRPQPDGSRWTDITQLRPGWVLLLPDDAAGPSVRVGAPPSADEDRTAAELLRRTIWAAVGLVLLGMVMLAVRAVAVRRRNRPPRALLPPPVDPFTADIVVDDPRRVTVTADDAGYGPFEGDVRSSAGTWQVRLTGIRVPDGTPAWQWLGPRDAPDGAMPVVLGHDGERRLCVDLAQAPSVFTIAGPLEVCREQARHLTTQLRAAGRTVLVVGDVLGEGWASGDEQVPAFPHDANRLPPGIVVSAGLEPADLPAARELATRTQGRTVAVVLGPVLRATWSMAARSSTVD